jgi:hypothetical protein
MPHGDAGFGDYLNRRAARLAAIEHAGNEEKPVRMVVVWGGCEEPGAG